jgi:DNA-binding response OmpR family regulator
MPSTNHILVVEDDRVLARFLKTTLQDNGYDVTLAFDGRSGIEKALSGKYDLIILDLKLPEVDGLEICRQVRASSGYIPILILSSKSSETDRVLGLEMGADDYLTKPFGVRELIARVKALFRRRDALKNSDNSELKVIELPDISIDLDKRTVVHKGKNIDLTAKEFDLLVQFARHPGRVYSRSQLLDLVWGYAYKGYEHTVNSHINRLRAKIEEDPNKPRHIITVWGVGYKFLSPGDEKEADA